MVDPTPPATPAFHCEDLITLFDRCFSQSHNTRLIKGGHEPLYLPAGVAIDEYQAEPFHQVIFAHGFFRSALHEVAHWLVAGDARRQQVDYGYWYEADGRNAQQQALFEQVEVHPQAIEWLLTRSTGHSFCVSVDNLNGTVTDPAPFKRAVADKVRALLRKPLAPRLRTFQQALASFYGQPAVLTADDFSVEHL